MWKDRGPLAVVVDGVDYVSSLVSYPFAEERRHPGSFHLLGQELRYVRHHYNRAWRNERSVELAIGFAFLDRHPGDRVLELGNVLSHYRPVRHDVLDKYERSPSVLNVDIVDFDPDEPYDSIISLSTLEHVGWDEKPREPEKLLQAYRNLKHILGSDGSMLVTCPLGQNPYLDESLRQETLDFPIKSYLRRVSVKNNLWQETSKEEIFDELQPAQDGKANALFVGMFDPQGKFSGTSG
jgi:hypothetical protein